MKLIVVDYESGNLRSVTRALETCGISPVITGEPGELRDADALVLPGVGSGPAAMAALAARGLVEPLREFAAAGKPFLGVCLGLQLLLGRTEEDGGAACLGIVPGRVVRLPETGRKIPHMGWNSIELSGQHPALQGIDSGSYFYFVHSYYAAPDSAEGVAGATEYGRRFCSIYARGNLIATQFHPEKSGAVGLRIYRNFIAMAAQMAQTAGRNPAASAAASRPGV